MIREKLQRLVETRLAVPFIYDDWNRANLRVAELLPAQADTMDTPLGAGRLPAVICLLPATGTLHLRNGNYRDAPRLQVAFVEDAERELDGAENDTPIERMKRLAMSFVRAFNDSGEFEPIGPDVPYYPIYRILSDVLTGVYIEITVQEREGVCWTQT